MEDKALIDEIRKWKKKRGAVILAHNYQRPEVQDIADFVGDSLQLSQEAAKTDARMIVFCGVHFMAETAKILNPDKTVVMPDISAGCPMANMIDATRLKGLKAEHPKAQVVCYVNTTAEVKALSDICCTSSNAGKVADSMESGELIFVPDKYLGEWTARKSKKSIILYPGYCPTHAKITDGDILALKKRHPHAVVLCHPECSVPVKALSDSVLSTGAMLDEVAKNPAREFIIATEQGILHQLAKLNPGKIFYPASASAVCPNMKKSDLPNILDALKEPGPHEVKVDKDVADRARSAIKRMLEIT